MIGTEGIESVCGLAAMQKGMFFTYAVDRGSDAYVEQFDFVGSGDVHVEHLRAALAATSRHYGVLRTIISHRNTDQPYQLVLEEWPAQVVVLDLRGRPDAEREVAEFTRSDRAAGFDLSAEPLLRATLLLVNGGRWHLVVTFHHIILDGWSLGPIFRTWFRYYDEITAAGSIRQQREEHPYAEYIEWYERQPDAEARRYWTEALAGYDQPAGPVPSRRADGYRSATHRFALPDALHTGVRDLARQLGVTTSSLVHAAWGVLLSGLTYRDDVVFGSVVSGRDVDVPGVQEMVGLFANTQPVRVRTGGDADFAGVCRAVHDAAVRASRYQHYPLDQVQSTSPLRNDLLDHVIAFENYPMSEQLRDFGSEEGGGIRLEGVEVHERSTYDFNVLVHPGPELTFTFLYNAEAYDPGFMAVLERSLLRLLSAVTEDPHRPVRDIALADPDPHEETGAPSATPSAIPLDSSVVEVFAGVVRRHGDWTAAVWRGREHTYRDLDRWSDALARRLRAHGVGAGVGVGVLLDRRPELVVSLLAILKSGAHYVPVDTKDAPARIASVLDDAGVTHLCTVAEFAGAVPAGTTVVPVDDRAGPADGPGLPRVPGTAPAYLMYTSGSTGRPKGCTITHRNILRLFADQTYMDFREPQVVLAVNSPAFDVSTLEVWGALLSGGTLVLPDAEIDLYDGDRLRATIERHGVRSATMSAPLFNQLCDHDPHLFAPLRYLCVGGSALSVRHIAKVVKACPDVTVLNGYGPTENTVLSTTHRVTAEDLRRDRIPIGRAIRHATAFVLDRGLRALPPGAVGELCLGGQGVSTGYHQRPELDRERFVVAPQLPGQRLYRTGDLVRELPDRTLDYLGRVDDQVKVGGFRVELGEVRAALAALDGVEDAAVVAVDHDGATQLVAHCVLTGGLTPDGVRRGLASRLAGYMIPRTVVAVDRIPLTKNGKVDQRRLAEAAVGPAGAGRPPTGSPGSGATVRALSAVIADVLDIDQVDPYRNFFELGVTSLSLMAINNRVRKTLGHDLPLTDYFEHTTVAALAAHLDSTAATTGAPAATEPAPVPVPVALSVPMPIDDDEEFAVRATGLLLDRFDDVLEGGVDGG